MFIKLANILGSGFDDRPHDDLTFCTWIVSLSDDVVCESIPARFSQSQAPCFQQVWFGQLHLGLKIPDGFIEVEAEFANVGCVACGCRHWSAAVQRSA